MTARTLDLNISAPARRPRVRRARQGEYIYTVAARRNLAPPWLLEEPVGVARFKVVTAFPTWRAAIQSVLRDYWGM